MAAKATGGECVCSSCVLFGLYGHLRRRYACYRDCRHISLSLGGAVTPHQQRHTLSTTQAVSPPARCRRG